MIRKCALLLSMCFVALFLSSASCTKDPICNGMGTLKLTNNSQRTVQRIMVDGVNYGSLDPSESKEYSLAPGQHDFQQVGISGGTGCSAAKVTIVECKTSGFSCNN